MSLLSPLLSRLSAAQVFDTGVLLVCLGNICRSPMAEAVLREKLRQSGLERRVDVASAGTRGERGTRPDERAASAAAARGYDLSRIRSRRLVDADFERFEFVLAMDRDNLEHLLERCPAPLQSRLGLLLDVAPRADGVREIPDPYYGPAEGFEHVLDMIEPACDALVHGLRLRLVAAP
jgi:protein-tyrosine phosphatase